MSTKASCCLAIIGCQRFQGFISSLPVSSFPSVTQLLSLLSSIWPSVFSRILYLLWWSLTWPYLHSRAVLALSLTSQSKSVWSAVVVTHLCRLSQPVTAWLTNWLGTWCLLCTLLTLLCSLTLQFPLFSSLHLPLIVFPGTHLLLPVLSSQLQFFFLFQSLLFLSYCFLFSLF